MALAFTAVSGDSGVIGPLGMPFLAGASHLAGVDWALCSQVRSSALWGPPHCFPSSVCCDLGI